MRGRDLLWLGGGVAVGFALGVAFPKLRKQFGPLITEASGRASELAAEWAAMVADQIERSQQQQGEPFPPPSDSSAS